MRAGPFVASGPPLRKSAIAGLILAVALPVPLMTASGLSIPLPAFAERMAVALAATVANQEPEKVAPAYRPVLIAHTAKEQAVIDRATAAIAPPSASLPPQSARLVAPRSNAPKAAPSVASRPDKVPPGQVHRPVATVPRGLADPLVGEVPHGRQSDTSASGQAGGTSGQAGGTSGQAGATSGQAGATSGEAGATSGEAGATSGQGGENGKIKP